MSKSPLAIVILAAGKGTRMKSDVPKVMHKLAGLPMINWLLKTTQDLKPERQIVVVGPDMPNLEKAVAPHQTVLQKMRDGTAGALKAAMPALKGFDGDVLVLLGDAPLVRAETLLSLIQARGECGAAVLGMTMDDPTGYGRLIVGDDGTLQDIVEEKDADLDQKAIALVNTGVFCLDGACLEGWLDQVDNKNAQKEFYITQIPSIIAKEGLRTAVVTASDNDEFLGCNTRADLAKMEGLVQGRLRMKAMESGVNLLDPASVYFQYDTQIEADVVVEPSVFFGPGVRIETGVHIKAFSHIESAHIAKDAVVGPFARIRPGTKIGESARIGNFVEIKKSDIGKRSKIGHLAYVGDCDMDADVNFSAGAITVNYDGFEKHKTIIGKGVMVGSNANLVAPVRIDDGAFIAAGSTITKNVPADSLSISRETAKIREGWATEYRKRKKAIVSKLKKKKKAS